MKFSKKKPVFFPDATRAVLRSLDSIDIKNTHTPGILVNTYHLYKDLGKEIIQKHKGVKNFMNWDGMAISDSGGFQVMSIAKRKDSNGKITDSGVTFKLPGEPKFHLTPEASIDFQMSLKTDMVVVLDDFTPPLASYEEAKDTVERTIYWAERSKKTFKRLSVKQKQKPLILGVVQGGKYQDLREYCTKELVKIGFDGLGYGGWPIDEDNNFDYESAKTIVDNAPKDYLLYGLGIGKPNEIVEMTKLGFTIFDCVLPTRDARHKRLYVYNANSIEEIDVNKKDFYSYYVPDKSINRNSTEPVSTACDCLLCKNYSRSYLAHLFKTKENTALRLATIHNLRFYSILMEKLSTT